MTEKQKTRKESALVRLEVQLKSGVKTGKTQNGLSVKVQLTDRDKDRIRKEILTLKQRV